MLNLIAKDFKLMFAKNGSRTSKILSWIFTILAGLLFIGLETYLFRTILSKISVYDGAAESFFILFLFIIAVIMIFIGMVTARKTFFSSEDITQLATYPISSAQKVFSKLFFLLITMYLFNLVFEMPLFIAYGSYFHKMVIYFYMSLYYPLLILIFELGFSLILVYPFKLLLDFLKKHFFLQLVMSLLISFAGAIAYSYILNIFIDLVSNNQLSSLFTTSNIELIKKIADGLIPVNFLIKAIVEYDIRMVFPYIGISLGVFLIGLALIVYFYSYFLTYNLSNNAEIKEHKYKKRSIIYAFIKKELILLFRDSNYLFSFTSLLFVEPLLTYLVVKAVNTIFSSGNIAYYVAVVPNLLPLTDVLLMMLFGAIISSGASNYLTSEKKNIRFIKSIPVSPLKQLAIKVLIPLNLSMFFMLLSWIVLKACKVVSWTTFLLGGLLSLLLIALVSVVSLFEELKIKRGKPRNFLLSTLYSYLLPFVFFLLSILMAYSQVNVYLIYSVGFLLVIISSLPFVIRLKSRVSNLFLELEVIN